jgi:aryl-alcohol dehydrogenase-like predicted oxidoreductase
MEQRTVGTSDLRLPVVTFGAWAIGGLFWGGSDDREAIEAIEASIDHGIDAIDTAPAYGCGQSEELVGRAVAGRRDKVKLLTKCGLRWEENSGEFYFTLSETPSGRPVTIYKNVTAHSIMEECENSLKRLRTDYIDLYQVHWPSKTASAEETIRALNRLKDQGKIRYFGVSNYSSGQLHEARKHGPVVSNQIKYNLLERGIEKDELPYCRKHRVGVICYSPMAMGLLTGKVTEERVFPASDIRSTSPLFSTASRRKVLQALESINTIAADHRTGFAQLSIAWVKEQPGITTALVGARTADQVKENVRAAGIKLSAEEVGQIRKVFEDLGDLRKVQ